ncbi:sialin-like [Antedon mediterranea]|uniref:sialin-like n=1 Tax=Antedon mediterranea TaxID=105859 RepID=UPI003AF59381
MIRYTIPFMCCLAMCILYCMRMNLNIAMTVMVQEPPEDAETCIEELRPDGENKCNNITTDTEAFDWNTTTQQLILGSFYIGYTIMPIPGGWLAGQIGGKRVIAIAVVWSSLLTSLIPTVADISVNLLIALRILDGLGQGIAVPGAYVLISKWAIPNERSTMVSITLSGMCMGLIISSYSSAWMCSSNIFGGWHFSFYSYGIAGAAWTLLWITLIYESPSVHPFMSIKEREHINLALNQTEQKRFSVPWIEIFCSSPVLALTLCMVTFEFGCYTLLSDMPLFFSHVLGYSLETAGLLTLVANIIQFGIKFTCGFIADVIINRSYLSVRSTRKMFVAITLGVSSFFLILLNYFDNNHVTVTVVLVTIVYSIYGFDVAGIFSNPMDLSPPFAGIISGLMLTASSITGFIGPLVLGTIINGENTLQKWNVFFAVVAGIHIFGLLVFLAFAQGEEQEWSKNAKVYEGESLALIRRSEKNQNRHVTE